MPRVEPIRSSLAADPVLGEIVEIFVEETPSRIDALLSQAAAEDWEALARTAHQLAGAFGGHGFNQLTPFAKRLEIAARQTLPKEQILTVLDELVGMCRRMQNK